ncbi:hypothetical protein ACN26Y_22200 [Micromonospora sp. WMMD558]|uniref:hypothetical protein n=1 Tax=unclassified Micromonospora TaxID=2617518 RepID=UPI0012B4C147|nr:hypothetical protein [Micromonospora sp. WMMC415]QGN48740.1 hypothetical protein GKC29_19215 [Micromonospora sp. WMMC415]
MAFRDKELRVPAPITVAGRRVKRYHIDQPERPLEPEVERAAYAFLPRLLPPAGADGTPPVSWVVLHRGADTGAYLLAYTWFFDNVVEAHVAEAGQPAIGCPDDDPTHFVEMRRPVVGCVWELGMLEHERAAWIRHVLAPDRPDVEAYVADTRAEGTVGW